MPALVDSIPVPAAVLAPQSETFWFYGYRFWFFSPVAGGFEGTTGIGSLKPKPVKALGPAWSPGLFCLSSESRVMHDSGITVLPWGRLPVTCSPSPRPGPFGLLKEQQHDRCHETRRHP